MGDFNCTLQKRVSISIIGVLLLITTGCSFNGFKPAENDSYVASSTSTFTISRNSVKLLPFSVRMTKIRALTQSADGSLYAELMNRRFELGDYDYATGVNQELTWTETRIGIWLKAIQPVCASNALKSRFPYPTSAGEFVKAAYGRSLNETDNLLLGQVNQASGTAAQKFEMLCTVVLSSLEFTTL